MALLPTPPIRGLIYDRNGLVLAQNVPAFSLEITPEQTVNLKQTLQTLQTLFNLSDVQIEKANQQIKTQPAFTSTILKVKLSEEEVAKFSVNRHKLPGVNVEAHMIRDYPFASTYAHIIGYVGKLNTEELAKINPALYRGTHAIGKVGIEKHYEHLLLGKPGLQQVEKDVKGRQIRVLEENTPTSGLPLTLTIDTNLQEKALQLLKNKKGAIVAISPQTGEILTLASSPTFDPNAFVSGIDTESYQHLTHSQARPLFNRAISGQYPPGSTLKPFLGLAGLDTGTITPETTIYDPGWYRLNEHARAFRGWKRTGHQKTNLQKAIRESCDTYYYKLADDLGIETLANWLTQFGFGQKTGIDLPNEQTGLVPTPEWKQKTYQTPWYGGDTLNTGIGQGYMLSTPLQLATAVAKIANQGKAIVPHLLKPSDDSDLEPHSGSEDIVLKKPTYWGVVQEAMQSVVTHPLGTAHKISHDLTYSLAAKTGTAQVFSLKDDQKYDKNQIHKDLLDHSLFVAFAPAKNPQIALSVLIENEGNSGQIARDFLDFYFNTQRVQAKKEAHGNQHPI